MNESNILGLSIRGILAFIITASCCGVAVWTKDLGVLKDLAFLVLGFYFGQKSISPVSDTPKVDVKPVITQKAD